MNKKHVSVPPALARTLGDEQGAMLVLAVMLLLLLTVVGLIATGGSITEMMITGNSRAYTDDIYKSDGANREISAYISIWPVTAPLVVKPLTAPNDLNDPDSWPDNTGPNPVPLGLPPAPNRDQGIQEAYNYRVEYDKFDVICTGSGMTNHLFDIRTVRNSTQIRVGYKRKGPDPCAGEE